MSRVGSFLGGVRCFDMVGFGAMVGLESWGRVW